MTGWSPRSADVLGGAILHSAVELGSHAAERGNETAVLQHFFRSMQVEGSFCQLAKKIIVVVPKSKSDDKLSANAVWAFLVHFVQF